MRSIRNLTASEGHSFNFCPQLMFFGWNKSLLEQTVSVENVEAEQDGSKERLSHTLEIED